MASLVGQELDVRVRLDTNYIFNLCFRLYKASYFYDKFESFAFNERIK